MAKEYDRTRFVNLEVQKRFENVVKVNKNFIVERDTNFGKKYVPLNKWYDKKPRMEKIQKINLKLVSCPLSENSMLMCLKLIMIRPSLMVFF